MYLPKIMVFPFLFLLRFAPYGKTAVSFSISEYRYKVNDTAVKMPKPGGNAPGADMESGSTVNHKFCNITRLHGASGTPPPTSHHCKGCRGEQCSPGEFSGGAGFLRASNAKPPLCKGRWHGVSRDGGIGACMGALGCTRKATIPQSALRLTAPFTQGGRPLPP